MRRFDCLIDGLKGPFAFFTSQFLEAVRGFAVEAWQLLALGGNIYFLQKSSWRLAHVLLYILFAFYPPAQYIPRVKYCARAMPAHIHALCEHEG